MLERTIAPFLSYLGLSNPCRCKEKLENLNPKVSKAKGLFIQVFLLIFPFGKKEKKHLSQLFLLECDNVSDNKTVASKNTEWLHAHKLCFQSDFLKKCSSHQQCQRDALILAPQAHYRFNWALGPRG